MSSQVTRRLTAMPPAPSADKWQGIGFVPFKEKESIQAAYTEAMQAKFPDFSLRAPRQGAGNSGRNGGFSRKPLSEKRSSCAAVQQAPAGH